MFGNLLSAANPAKLNSVEFFIAVAVLVGIVMMLALIGRFACGKHSVLHTSVSSSIGILFIYALTIVIHSTGLELGFMLSPLPFVRLSGDYLYIFDISANHYTAVCGELLNMIVLAFTVNIIDRWMPTGKKLLGWFAFRCLSVILGTLAFTGVMYLANTYLPEGFITWAPVILLCIMIVSLLLGALKLVVGAIMSTVSPLLAVLYTFFFASVLGKMLSRAMLTTVIMAALVYALNHFGVSVLFIGVAGLTAYIPLLLILLVLWYVVGHLL